MSKYFIATFGCQANTADSEKTAEIMESLVYSCADDMENLVSAKNPVLIFNTCSVRQKAEDRVFGLNNKLQQLKIANCKLKIVLTGCMMHYSEKELKKRLPFFDYFVDIKNIETLSKLFIKNVTDKQRSHHKSTSIFLKGGTLKKNWSLANGHILNNKKKVSKISALIPISHGCDNFCTYCIVPLARGREISRKSLDIVSDVKRAVDNGSKEIWLLGQTVNSYKNGDVDFSKLLRLVNDIPGDFWIRFTSPHPKDFSDDLILAMAECEKFAHYINLPVQSGNNAVLKRMGRPYTVSHYKKLIGKIRKAIPNIAISTDIIVGFPGETRKQFEDTVKLFKKIKFDMAFISEYSPRPKTAAAKMFKDDISREEKENRKNELNEILKKTAFKNNQKLVGQIVKVLNGRTEGNKPIEITEKYLKNKFVLAKIIKANIWSLRGKLI